MLVTAREASDGVYICVVDIDAALIECNRKFIYYMDSGADPEGGGRPRGHGPPQTVGLLLHNVFKVGKCIGSKYEGPFFFGSLPLQ